MQVEPAVEPVPATADELPADNPAQPAAEPVAPETVAGTEEPRTANLFDSNRPERMESAGENVDEPKNPEAKETRHDA